MTASSGRPRLLLLDGHSLAYRAFYALPVENFSTTTGQATNAVYGFTSMLINALRDEQPTHLAVAFDVSRQTFRSVEYPEYKATRSASPDEFKGQVPLIREVLTALNVPYVEVEGFEADDLIATLTTQAEAAGFDVLIITGDRDAYQLVDEHVTVLYPKKGVSDLARMTPEAVQDKYGLSPAQYPDYAALRGDPSDNLPSIPGVGEKTAAKWVREFGSLAELVERVDEVKGKAGDSLRAGLSDVVRNRRLTELVRDVPLPLAPADLERRSFDRDTVHEVFDALQFRVLRERLFALHGDDAAPAGAAEDVEVAAPAAGGLGTWLAEHAAAGVRVGLVLDGTWGRGTGDVESFAIASPDGAVAWWPVSGLLPDDESALSAWLADPARPKAMHDAKGPVLALRARGLPLSGLTCDTALAAYLVLPGQRSFDLSDLVPRFLKRDLAGAAAAGSDQLSFDTDPDEARAASMGMQAKAVLDLAGALEDELEVRGGTALMTDVELPLLSVLADLEQAGIAVDLDHLHGLEDEFAESMRGAEASAHELAGRPFNLGSPKQLQEILFGERGLPTTKKIKTGYTTDADALQSLFAQTGDPLLEQLLRWRDVSKLRQTVTGLLSSVSDDTRIHTTFNQIVAATGRLSSQDPNLQNIPIRTDEGRRIRSGFVVGPGYECLLTADYSQIEMRLMAHLSEDAGLIEAFNSGEDLHNYVASRVFGVAPSEVDASQRSKIKAMSYGLAYGLSPFGLSQQLGITPGEASGLMDEYFERFGGVRDYLREVVDRARGTGYTETMLGRRRYLPDLTSDVRQRREMAERMALNAPIQGSAADIVKVAMLRVDSAIRARGLASRMLLQVHDELVLEVAPGELDAVREVVTEGMGGAVPLTVPLDVSVGVGRTWEDAGH
ncbi:DNA polymerase I [Longivirga aurantiaca]|uniref:DNA polymerase I n=1 Tax=Longivirga aurantiaca TaxID=1837743 RepID=A0ABW1T1H2_9ACTN